MRFVKILSTHQNLESVLHRETRYRKRQLVSHTHSLNQTPIAEKYSKGQLNETYLKISQFGTKPSEKFEDNIRADDYSFSIGTNYGFIGFIRGLSP